MAGVAPQYGFHFQVWALAEALIQAQKRDGAFYGSRVRTKLSRDHSSDGSFHAQARGFPAVVKIVLSDRLRLKYLRIVITFQNFAPLMSAFQGNTAEGARMTADIESLSLEDTLAYLSEIESLCRQRGLRLTAPRSEKFCRRS
jgi:hypothetical protein